MAKHLGIGRMALVLVAGLSLASCGPTRSDMNGTQLNSAMADGNLTGDTAAPLTGNAMTTPAPAASASTGGNSMPTSCEAEIGRDAATKLADQCRQVSGATRPPCNIANSCAILRDEISRNCGAGAPGGKRPDACDVAQTNTQQAADVIKRYYSAINAKDYGTAYALWGNGGKSSGQTPAQFRKGFADTRKVSVTIGTPAEPEGAAGSIYVTVPVKVDAMLKNGKAQHFFGKYIIRRVNDVPGATQQQRRWHLYSAQLRPLDQAMQDYRDRQSKARKNNI